MIKQTEDKYSLIILLDLNRLKNETKVFFI